MKITNAGKDADRLTGGTFPNAARFEIHEMKTEGSVVTMRPLPKGLEIKPGETVEFKPGGYHVMFMGLKQGLKEGQTVKGTLTFEKAGTIDVEYRVGPIGGGARRRPADTSINIDACRCPPPLGRTQTSMAGTSPAIDVC